VRLPAFPEVDIHSLATRDGWVTAQAPRQQRAHRVADISPVRDNPTGLQLSQMLSPACGMTCKDFLGNEFPGFLTFFLSTLDCKYEPSVSLFLSWPGAGWQG